MVVAVWQISNPVREPMRTFAQLFEYLKTTQQPRSPGMVQISVEKPGNKVVSMLGTRIVKNRHLNYFRLTQAMLHSMAQQPPMLASIICYFRLYHVTVTAFTQERIVYVNKIYLCGILIKTNAIF